VQLEAEAGLAALLSPRSIPAPPGSRLLSPGPLGRGVAGVGGDEGGVLDDALLDIEAPLVQLLLQLSPDSPVPAGFGEALPELPHRRVVRRLLREPEKPLEAEAVVHLPLQLRVAEVVPLLEHEELHHHHLVHVGPASPQGVVAVDGSYDGSEGLPVYEAVDPGEPVAVLPDVLVGFFEHIDPEGGHVCLWGCHDL